MDPRLTTEITLPASGARVVLYNTLVSGDYKIIQREVAKLMKIDMSAIPEGLSEEEAQKDRDSRYKEAMKNISGEVVILQDELVAKLSIKEAFYKDGSKVEDIAAFLYNLPIPDGKLIDEEIKKIDDNSVHSEEQKKNSPRKRSS